MLSELTIENFAIIDRLHLRLEKGFSALTGETGAGKSIIIDALQLVLGGRASGDLVRDGAPISTVEAIFTSGDGNREILALLDEQGIETDGDLILRREIAPNGRSTARINGRDCVLAVFDFGFMGGSMGSVVGEKITLAIERAD